MSNPKNPIITFRINLTLNSSESVGPNTNPNNTAILHPDMHDTDADRGRTNSAQHASQRLTFLPGLLAGENIVQVDDSTFIAYGMKASYLKRMFTTGTNPLLEVVSETFESA